MSKYRNQALIEDIEEYLYAPERQTTCRDPFEIRYVTELPSLGVKYYSMWGAVGIPYIQPLAKLKDDRCEWGYCYRCSPTGTWKWGHDAFYGEGELTCPVSRKAIPYDREFAAIGRHP